MVPYFETASSGLQTLSNKWKDTPWLKGLADVGLRVIGLRGRFKANKRGCQRLTEQVESTVTAVLQSLGDSHAPGTAFDDRWRQSVERLKGSLSEVAAVLEQISTWSSARLIATDVTDKVHEKEQDLNHACLLFQMTAQIFLCLETSAGGRSVPTYFAGADYFMAKGQLDGQQVDRVFFHRIISLVKESNSRKGLIRSKAKEARLQVYESRADLMTTPANIIGGAAAYEALRYWQRDLSCLMPVIDDARQEEEAVMGLAVAESLKLWGYVTRYTRRVPSESEKEEAAEVAAATVRQICRSHNPRISNQSPTSPGLSPDANAQRGISYDGAKRKHHSIYKGLIDVMTASPSNIGGAAAYEALRFWQTKQSEHAHISDEQNEDYIVSLAEAETKKLWDWSRRLPSDRALQTASGIAAATVRRLFPTGVLCEASPESPGYSVSPTATLPLSPSISYFSQTPIAPHIIPLSPPISPPRNTPPAAQQTRSSLPTANASMPPPVGEPMWNSRDSSRVQIRSGASNRGRGAGNYRSSSRAPLGPSPVTPPRSPAAPPPSTTPVSRGKAPPRPAVSPLVQNKPTANRPQSAQNFSKTVTGDYRNTARLQWNPRHQSGYRAPAVAREERMGSANGPWRRTARPNISAAA